MIILNEGGSGSGNFGHKGRPGKKGGSAKRLLLTLASPTLIRTEFLGGS